MFRKRFIALLLDQPMTVAQIARITGEPPRDIAADFEHFLRSVAHTEYEVQIEPARCRKCGFEFSRERLLKPSKCPDCKSTWLREPRIGLQTKPPRNTA